MNNENFVRDFFARHAKQPLPTGADGLKVHYLDEGLIDSFGIVTLITEIESGLGINLTAEDMQSYEFLTVGGLIGIIDRSTKNA
jgi:acyl carrier protein